MPDGTFLPLQCGVTISDSMGTDSMGCPKATITLLVEVVNEKPQPKIVVDTKCGKVSID